MPCYWVLDSPHFPDPSVFFLILTPQLPFPIEFASISKCSTCSSSLSSSQNGKQLFANSFLSELILILILILISLGFPFNHFFMQQILREAFEDAAGYNPEEEECGSQVFEE